VKKNIVAWAAIMSVCGTVAAHAAEGSTQYVDLYVNDPTQAQSNDSWRFMASAEYWYMYAPDERESNLGYSGTISGGIPGGSAYASRGPWSFMASYRPGSYAENFHCEAGKACNFSPYITPLHNKLDTTEMEFKIRYTFAGADIWGFQPYVLGGFHLLDATSQWTSPSYPLPPNAGSVYYHERQIYNTPELGAGVLRAFSETWGMRADVSVGYAMGHDKHNYSSCPGACDETSSSANGGGVNSYLTVYHYFTPMVVGQVGARAAFVDAESNNYSKGPGSLGAIGVFTSIAVNFGG